VQLLLNYKANPNIKNGGAPFVNGAIENRFHGAIELLVRGGATIRGLASPPLRAGNREAVEILLRLGASPAEKFGGATIEEYAAKKKWPLARGGRPE